MWGLHAHAKDKCLIVKVHQGMSLTFGSVFEDTFEAKNASVVGFWKFYKKRTSGPSY